MFIDNTTVIQYPVNDMYWLLVQLVVMLKTVIFQVWFETDKNELVLAQLLCMDAGEHRPKLSKCHEMGGSQEWKHHSSVSSFFH